MAEIYIFWKRWYSFKFVEGPQKQQRNMVKKNIANWVGEGEKCMRIDVSIGYDKNLFDVIGFNRSYHGRSMLLGCHTVHTYGGSLLLLLLLLPIVCEWRSEEVKCVSVRVYEVNGAIIEDVVFS